MVAASVVWKSQVGSGCSLGGRTSREVVTGTCSSGSGLKVRVGEVLEIRGGVQQVRRPCSRVTSLARKNMNWAVRAFAAVPGVELEVRRGEVSEAIEQSLENCLVETHLNEEVKGLGPKIRGKVRDMYEAGDYVVLVTTDRQSAFDRVLASVPFKGQVLNETSGWWFDNAQHITTNAVVAIPDPNVTIARKCSVFPVEFVVRGYVTGSTSTSLWTIYNKGVRNYCGNVLPDGFVKNQCLDVNILTPTTKAADHDVPISGQEIVEQGLMSKEDYAEVSSRALALFAYGQETVKEHGLLLVDTKYEFGKTADGSIVLVDEEWMTDQLNILITLNEGDLKMKVWSVGRLGLSCGAFRLKVHTPDSSRYWIAASYEERQKLGLEPENIDKEFLRLWFMGNCDPYADEVLPDAPTDLVAELSWRYILLFETITGRQIKLPSTKESVHDRISRNVQRALLELRL